MSLLNGIPISDEQCIGDSLDTINNAFLSLSSATTSLSSRVTQLSGNLALSAQNLLTLIQSVSTAATQVFVSNNATFSLSAVHRNGIVFLTRSAGPVTVNIAPNQTWVAGHTTAFVQTGTGEVTFNGFSTLNGNQTITGQYGGVVARYGGQSYPTWSLVGDLGLAVAPPTALLSLQALQLPGAEDTENEIALTGPRPDTIYYREDTLNNIEYATPPMQVYINNIWRTTCDYTVERTGSVFGYRIANFRTNTTGPQVSGIFTPGAVRLTVPGFAPELTYLSLTGTNVPGIEVNTGESLAENGNEDSYNDITFTTAASAVGATIFYLADPDPSSAGFCEVELEYSTDGGATYPFYVGTLNISTDREGQVIGIKRPGVFGGPEGTNNLPATLVDGQTYIVRFIVSNTPRPTPTVSPSPTVSPTGPTRTPTATPTRTPTPSLSETRVSLTAAVTPGNEDLIHNVAFTSEATNYNDTIYYFTRELQDFEMESPMIVYVNGTRRTVVEFPNDFTGTQFGYRLAGAVGTQPQAYGSFAPGRVDLTISGSAGATPTPTPTRTPTPTPTATGDVIYASLRAQLTPGSEDPSNQVAFTSTANRFNDTIRYAEMEYVDFITTTMNVYLSGVYRTTVEFLDDRLTAGAPYNTMRYTLAGVLDANGPGSGTIAFTSGSLDLSSNNSIATVVHYGSALSASLPDFNPNEDSLNLIDIESLNASYAGDRIYYYPDNDPKGLIQAAPMTVRVNGTNRTVVNFLEERLGTPFGYSITVPPTGIEAYGLFRSGTVSLTI